MRFEFATANRIIFGAGAVAQAGPLAKEFGRRALLTTGRNAVRAKPLLDSLSKAGVQTVPLPVEGEPDLDVVRNGVALARRENCDLVIACGGGSALDSGKAIAIMLTNGGDVLDYLEVIGAGKTFTQPSAPFLAIPTTAGTGSEVTRNAVLSSPQHRSKASLRSPFMLPKVALVDPELTWDTPPAVTARTGLDALTQLIEPYVTPRANPMTDGLCLEAIPRVACSLREAFSNGHNAAAREDMALASLFGGLALSNAGLGAVHGLAGPIGGMFGAPHGAICGALLAPAMEANIAALRARDSSQPALGRYETIARLLTGRDSATADGGVEWVRRIVTELKIPSLRACGLKAEHLAELIEKSRHASSMKANPIVLKNEEIEALVASAF